MAKVEDDFAPHKTDDAKGENTAQNRVDKVADEAAKKAGKTEQNYDRREPVFSK